MTPVRGWVHVQAAARCLPPALSLHRGFEWSKGRQNGKEMGWREKWIRPRIGVDSVAAKLVES